MNGPCPACGGEREQRGCPVCSEHAAPARPAQAPDDAPRGAGGPPPRPAPPPGPVAPRFPPDLLDRFEPTRILHRSRFTTLWAARQRALDRGVAVRVAHADHPAIERIRRRLAHEAQLLAMVSDPRVVAVLDYGVDDPAWIAYRFLHGQSLRERIAAGPVPLPRAVVAVRDLLLGLDALHRARIVHRGIKSSRIVESDPGTWRLIGCRSALQEPAAGTRAPLEWSIIGVPPYMAPETGAGEPHSRASDIYSAGVVLYEALAGRRPFLGASAPRLLMQHLNEPPPPPGDFAPVPRALEQVVLTALSKLPQDRFGNAAEMADALDACPFEI